MSFPLPLYLLLGLNQAEMQCKLQHILCNSDSVLVNPTMQKLVLN